MRKVLFLFSCLSLSPSFAFAYGEGENIPSDARAIHLLINESRTDTKAALADCGSNCLATEKYDAIIAPLYWDDGLHDAAQFHANMHSYLGGMCLTHDSPCTLKSSVASDYPDTCDGNPSCACKEGQAKCGNKGTNTFERIRMFTKLGYPMAENIAWSGSLPYEVHLQFLHEDGKQTYGHRASILNPSLHSVGIGRHTKWTVEDFGGTPNITSPISAGAYHYSGDKTELWFKAHYYADAAAAEAKVSLGDTCLDLAKTIGTEKHGVWGIHVDAPAKCTPYVYEIKDDKGTITRFPTTGSLLFDCEKSWQTEENTSCFVNDDNPDDDNPGDNPNDDNTGDNPNDDNTGDNPDDDNTGDNPGNNPNDDNTGDDNTGDDNTESDDSEDTENQDDHSGNANDKENGETVDNGTDSDCSLSPYRQMRTHGGLLTVFGILSMMFLRRRKQQC